MQASSAEIVNYAKDDPDAKREIKGAHARSDNYQNKRRGSNNGRRRVFPLGHGRGGNPPRGGGHQVIFCKTRIEERSDNEIETIYQSKGGD